jgi:hypothetical protein
VFEDYEFPSAGPAAACLGAAVDELLEHDLTSLSTPELLTLVGSVEEQKRRLAVLDHALVAELHDRRVAAEVCLPNTATLLVYLLRIAPGVAKARVRAAANLGPRRGLTGERLAPLFEQVAAAQADGLISPEHARVIVDAVDSLPLAVQAEHDRSVEATLVMHAADLDPSRLATAAARLHAYLDPDGRLADDADHRRVREMAMSRHRDGSYHLVGHLTPECGAVWQPIFDSLARPMPATDGAVDPRRPGQRMHDAFEQVARLLDTERLPEVGGLPVMLILTATAEQAETGSGFARTGHGGLIPIARAVELVGEGRTLSAQFDPHGGVLDYGRTQRLVPRDMRLALIARDRGCTFPDCDRPPAWTEAHHFIEWSAGGSTSIANTGLVCGFHHREFAKRGWTGEMINGVPHWIPPAWLDPGRKPRRNTSHNPPLTTMITIDQPAGTGSPTGSAAMVGATGRGP